MPYRWVMLLVLTSVTVGLGVVVCAMSAVGSFWPLVVAITLTRGLLKS